jgi:hypothetical protein
MCYMNTNTHLTEVSELTMALSVTVGITRAHLQLNTTTPPYPSRYTLARGEWSSVVPPRTQKGGPKYAAA